MFGCREGARDNMDHMRNADTTLEEKIKVLAIMDRADYRDLVQNGLDKKRYELMITSALDAGMIESVRFKPDVILIDLEPNDSAIRDACMGLKKPETAPDALLIVLTRVPNVEILKAAFSAGADDVFDFPFQADCELDLRLQSRMKRDRAISNELQRTKQFLENLIDSSVDAIVSANMKGDIILFNQGAERLFAYRADEVIGKMHVTNLYPPGVAHEVMEALRGKSEAQVGHLNTSRKEVINKAGEFIPVQLTAWMVTDHGQEIASAGIFMDLRERLKIERKLSLAQEKLMKTEKQAMIAELAGAAAHELNQPLTSVLGYVELAKRKVAQEEKIDRILESIFSQAARMAEIVRKLGKITRYETKSYVGDQRIMDIERSSEPE